MVLLCKLLVRLDSHTNLYLHSTLSLRFSISAVLEVAFLDLSPVVKFENPHTYSRVEFVLVIKRQQYGSCISKQFEIKTRCRHVNWIPRKSTQGKMPSSSYLTAYVSALLSLNTFCDAYYDFASLVVTVKKISITAYKLMLLTLILVSGTSRFSLGIYTCSAVTTFLASMRNLLSPLFILHLHL